MKNIRGLMAKCTSGERKNRVRQTRKMAQSSAVWRRCAEPEIYGPAHGARNLDLVQSCAVRQKGCAGPILRIVV